MGVLIVYCHVANHAYLTAFNSDYIDIGKPEHTHITLAVGVRRQVI